MKTQIKFLVRIMVCIVFFLSLTRCETEQVTQERGLQLNDLNAKTSNNKSAKAKFNFTAHLSGDNEVPAVETSATGQAIVKISEDESWIYYKLTVAKIENAMMAHFHMKREGEPNGGVVAWLYNNINGQPSGISNGVLAEGVIMAEDIIGSIEGDMSALVEAMRNGEIYVNIHTTTNRSGELRGDL